MRVAAARDDDAVGGEALGKVHGAAGVVVDVPAFGGAEHDCFGAGGGEGRTVEDVGFAVGGAGEDLVEFGVPEDGY